MLERMFALLSPWQLQTVAYLTVIGTLVSCFSALIYISTLSMREYLKIRMEYEEWKDNRAIKLARRIAETSSNVKERGELNHEH